jgi:hypothetical protein
MGLFSAAAGVIKYAAEIPFHYRYCRARQKEDRCFFFTRGCERCLKESSVPENKRYKKTLSISETAVYRSS